MPLLPQTMLEVYVTTMVLPEKNVRNKSKLEGKRSKKIYDK